ncbi:hypothetical protein FA15DRAFT_600766, partial [Coprinopsis marcescibilis]
PQFKACFDASNKNVSICAYVKIPLIPEIKLGCVTGNIANGVEIKISLGPISGLLRFYTKSGWLWLYFEVKILGKAFKGDLKLIPLP